MAVISARMACHEAFHPARGLQRLAGTTCTRCLPAGTAIRPFERAADTGFGAVELWWPGLTDAQMLPGLPGRWNMRLALLNFDAGDMDVGEQGLADDPRHRERLRATYPPRRRSPRRAAASGFRGTDASDA